MILGYDPETLGVKGAKLGKVVVTTRVFIRCDECQEKEWSALVSNQNQRISTMDLCQGCKNRLHVSGMGGHRHSDEFKQKMSKRLTGDNNPSKRQDVKEKISQAQIGIARPWLAGKKRPEHSEKMKIVSKAKWAEPEYREIMQKALAKSRKHSMLHDSIKACLESIGFSNFISEQPVGYYTVDELDELSKAVIEINGRYWHADPRLYVGTDLIWDKTAESIWDFDRRKMDNLMRGGYTVFLFWEHDWLCNTQQAIIKFLRWRELVSDNVAVGIYSTMEKND